MPYATVPIISGNFNTSTSYLAKPISNQFQKGTVDDRGKNGINSVSHSRQIREMIVGETNEATLENFLANTKGRIPFWYQPFLDKSIPLRLYICKDYTFKRISVGLYEFTATFEQVYRAAD